MKGLLLIHGLLSNKEAFNYYISKLNNSYDHILCIDLPGHGENKMKFNTNNVKTYILKCYDSLRSKCAEIDVIGYSLGGIVACYLQSKRTINKLILLAPAYRYFNLKNYKPVKGNKSKVKLKGNNYLNLIRFFKVNSDLKLDIEQINSPTLIIWGRDDYLVKESSGLLLYKKIKNTNRQYLKLTNHNHYNILKSDLVLKEMIDFLK